MQDIGKAGKGDRTMIDALLAGSEYLAAEGDKATLEGLGKATRAGADAAK